jgi:hypothetical protein
VRIVATVCLLSAVLWPARLEARQSDGHASVGPDSSVAHFLARARTGVRHYQRRSAAIADGYRRIGPDFPGMGEHWIQLSGLFRDTLDPARPPVLEYAVIAGTPRLVGVAYALPLLAGESPPEFPSVHAWHEHVGTVAGEAMLLDQVHVGHGGADSARIVMLHAWVGLDNPAGVFVSDNWVLPFVRAGLPVPGSTPSPAAGRAVSLITGGDVFYATLAQAVGRPGAADSITIRTMIERSRREVAAFVQERHGESLAAADLAALGAKWDALWAAIGVAVQPDVRDRLARLMAP